MKSFIFYLAAAAVAAIIIVDLCYLRRQKPIKQMVRKVKKK